MATGKRLPLMAGKPIIAPGRYRWPTFFQTDNLLNVANQIVVIAVIAVGMTMVIITGYIAPPGIMVSSKRFSNSKGIPEMRLAKA